MGRAPRPRASGIVFHALNRAIERHQLFREAADYEAFEGLLAQTIDRFPLTLLAYCLMPNHWHLVVRPEGEGALSRGLQWLTGAHARRSRRLRGSTGRGSLYQGRFRAFPIQTDQHFLTVCRYVESNAHRAGLIGRAIDWRWGSAWRRGHAGGGTAPEPMRWPVSIPRGWAALLQTPLPPAQLVALRVSTNRGQPFGDERWTREMVHRHGLEATIRSPGRQPEA